jgi:hypothetical protein
MNVLRHGLHALGVCAAAVMMAGCGGAQNAAGAMPQTLMPGGGVARGGSWMKPGAKRMNKLLYISDQRSNDVYVYEYSTGYLVGRLTGFYMPWGQCVDAVGNIWITDYQAQSVDEFAHGGTQVIKTMRTHGVPDSCSIDPTPPRQTGVPML